MPKLPIAHIPPGIYIIESIEYYGRWSLLYLSDPEGIFILEPEAPPVPISAVSQLVPLQAFTTDIPNVYQILVASHPDRPDRKAYGAEGPESDWAVDFQPLITTEPTQKWKFKPHNKA
ncbi:hypothetical protein Clacol_010343 [Clathrus columnatus]|uniref:Uncharacterized protein n=1 Tax=Clathrus columnatus TaxID=1419009 RepID=A0AAV5AN81_9AGAM|nr:hypothetical protein Clacol_010343 [Clathrus columnatus]